MKIEDFIKESIRQITAACDQEGVYAPKDIEFSLQININGEVCSQGDIAVCSLKVCL